MNKNPVHGLKDIVDNNYKRIKMKLYEMRLHSPLSKLTRKTVFTVNNFFKELLFCKFFHGSRSRAHGPRFRLT
ncbi:hypothetical protein TPS_06313 [Trichinella pseudospiralis]